MRAATALLATASAFGLANAACSIVKNVKTTFYGWDDNTPVGDETAFNCGGRNNHAGGVGTYANPLTFASDPSEYNTCEIVYVPYLQKYLRMEDKCYACCECPSSPARMPSGESPSAHTVIVQRSISRTA